MKVATPYRRPIFPAAVWEAYDRVATGADGWEAQLDQWGVTLAVVQAGDSGLAGRLTAAGWQPAYSDVDGVILLAPER